MTVSWTNPTVVALLQHAEGNDAQAVIECGALQIALAAMELSGREVGNTRGTRSASSKRAARNRGLWES
jgi:hypothetical protein